MKCAWRVLLVGCWLSIFSFGEIDGQNPADTTRPKQLDRSLLYPLRKVFKAELFQGAAKRHNYFEGWYFKLVAPGGAQVFSVIPGIAYGEGGTAAHAFIQLINGKTGETQYERFPVSDFRYSKRDFRVEIGDNRFGMDGIKVAIGSGNKRFEADLRFGEPRRMRGKLRAPGIMGWYRYAPFMETYHGLVSMSHRLQGKVRFGGASYDFSSGKGYTEKDWGHTFPSSWVWMQSNHFADADVSFMCSIAKVPWIGYSFRGFLGFLMIGEKVYRFATYTGARLEDLRLEGERVTFRIRDRHWTLEVTAKRSRTGLLQAPVAGAMDRRIAESVDAEIAIRLLDRKGTVCFEGTGKFAGLEVVGDREELFLTSRP